MANKNKTQQGVQKSDISHKENSENGQMPEDVIERKMFDFDAVRKETDGGNNDTFESSDDVEVQVQESQPSDKATQNSSHNTLDRRSNIQGQQCKTTEETCSKEDGQKNKKK